LRDDTGIQAIAGTLSIFQRAMFALDLTCLLG
jgi:hypothetical protein